MAEAKNQGLPPYVQPEFCKATQKDANGVTHRCSVTGSHTRHVCTPACLYAWQDGKRGRKPAAT